MRGSVSDRGTVSSAPDGASGKPGSREERATDTVI